MTNTTHLLTAADGTREQLDAMARDAATELGASSNVYVKSENFTSRYVQYLLRTPGEVGSHYVDGLAVVVAVTASDKKHTFPRPILVANGEGLHDPRKPFHFMQLVEALASAGLRTNDLV